MALADTDHLTLWNLGPQQLLVDFQGGRIVSDAGLLAVRALERPLRVIADLAPQLPDPRSPKFIRHSVEAILTQEVYALLAGYPDHNDADLLRTDPLFQILADSAPTRTSPSPAAVPWHALPTPLPAARPHSLAQNGPCSWRCGPPKPNA